MSRRLRHLRIVRQRNLYKLPPQRHRRIERTRRLLIDHRDLRPPNFAEPFLGSLQEIFPKKLYGTGFHIPILPEIIHHRKSNRALTATRFAHNADSLALMDAEIEIYNRRDLASARPVRETQIATL